MSHPSNLLARRRRPHRAGSGADGGGDRARCHHPRSAGPPSPVPSASRGVRVLPEWPSEALPAFSLDAYTAVALLTHDPRIDDQALVAALRSRCFYIGALGLAQNAGATTRAHDRGGLLGGRSPSRSRTDRPRTSALKVRRRSPSPSWARSSPRCARSLCARRRRRRRPREITVRVAVAAGRRSHPGAFRQRSRCRPAQGRGDRCCRDRRAGTRRHRVDHRRSARSWRRRRERGGAQARGADRRGARASGRALHRPLPISSPRSTDWFASMPMWLMRLTRLTSRSRLRAWRRCSRPRRARWWRR